MAEVAECKLKMITLMQRKTQRDKERVWSSVVQLQVKKGQTDGVWATPKHKEAEDTIYVIPQVTLNSQK